MKILGYVFMALILVCVGVLIYAGCTDQSFIDVLNSIFGANPDVSGDVTTPDTTTPEVTE